jgi:putative glutamine amidotransferase
MKLIGITQRIIEVSEVNEQRDSLDHRLVELVLSLSMLPIPIPNKLITRENSTKDQLIAWLTKINLSGIILSGGEDLGKNLDRDNLEFGILNWAKSQAVPVLGICRGMQIMGSWAGIELVEIPNHIKTRHQLNGKIQQDVNSFHNFSLKDCPIGFTVMAESSDRAIEAIRHTLLPWEGWMWHPEREIPYSKVDVERIRNLFDVESEPILRPT